MSVESREEKARINDLLLYKILDTATETTFDNLTRLASIICEVPISLISFVGAERQWFKSRVGLSATETPRDQAFCAHAIRNEETMIVEDTYNDPRFVDNPLVTGEPRIRFYAGAPLRVASGSSLGTLCVIDSKPRTLTDTQKYALEVLRDAVVSQLELKRTIEDMKALEHVIPMCAWCRKIRLGHEGDRKIEWQPLHEYVSSVNRVTHGICPSCKESMMKK